ncbi:MICOS complex subunit MIC60-like [Phragmites australis]|uniref:MICOS complex subunit MIC60-like n=1 Tax=Phragmites australis TaxID=29695 RepID=UPI002D78F200|nr:MICOS complex subunit MIC60-like [Phragmites australis]
MPRAGGSRRDKGVDGILPDSRPPKDAAGDQRQPEASRPAPTPELSAPEPSASAKPEPQGPPCPEPRAAADAGRARPEHIEGGAHGHGKGGADAAAIVDPERLCREGSQGTQCPAVV